MALSEVYGELGQVVDMETGVGKGIHQTADSPRPGDLLVGGGCLARVALGDLTIGRFGAEVRRTHAQAPVGQARQRGWKSATKKVPPSDLGAEPCPDSVSIPT